MNKNWLIFTFLASTVLTQKIDGDVGIEDLIAQSNLVTVDPANPFNIPTINWEDILKNIPTIPPIVLPTLDPNFWQNIPTLPPLPTLDPDFWKNLPTLPPLPTLDPNFWQNLISLPTLPPLQIPTLDSNFWKNLPTLPPIPTPTPRTAQCTYKLGQEVLTNSSFAETLNYTNVQSVLDEMLQKSVEICNGFQTQKLTDLSLKYGVLQGDLQEITPYFSNSDLQKLLVAVLQGDSGAVFQILFSKTLENLANPTVTGKISKVQTQISTLQFELLFSPI